jgi:hypothetical protein
MINERYALPDFYRDGFYDEIVFFDAQAYDTGTTVQWLLLIEDEVADTIVDLPAVIVLNGLKGMGMMTDQDISTCQDELMSL